MSIATRKKAQLAMTNDDHRKEGHDPLPILQDTSGVTLEQVLTASHSLDNFIRWQIRETTESYEFALRGNGSDEKSLRVMVDFFLGPNIAYLRDIGRLSKEFADIDPYTKFALPAKVK